MALILNDFLSGEAILDVLAERKALNHEPSYALESILPYQPVDELQYEHIVGEYYDPIIASFSAFEKEGEYRGRDGIKKFIEELRPIKQSMRLSGKLMIEAAKAGSESPLVAQLFKDVPMVYDGVRVRLEAMRMEVLTTGKLSIDENGVEFVVDYQVPTDNIVTITDPEEKWSDTTNADPIGDMTSWMNDLDFTPRGGIISKKIMQYLLSNKNVRAALFGSDLSSRVPSLGELNNYLENIELPKLYVDKDTYRNNDATHSRSNIWPDQKFVWVGNNIGRTLCGPTEEGVLNENVVRSDNGIYVQVNKIAQPPKITTHASVTSLIALPAPHEVFIANVIDA
jgi:hypothetical protein